MKCNHSRLFDELWIRLAESFIKSKLIIMEIGSFLELDIERTGEYFPDNENVARLNSARAGIYHSLQVMQCDDIYVPYYQCPTVNSFLGKKGVKIYQYYLSNTFKPLLNRPENKSAILIVNYFGIF